MSVSAVSRGVEEFSAKAGVSVKYFIVVVDSVSRPVCRVCPLFYSSQTLARVLNV